MNVLLCLYFINTLWKSTRMRARSHESTSLHELCQNVPRVWQSRMTNKERCLHSWGSLLRLDCHCSNLDPRIRDGERPNVSSAPMAPNGSKSHSIHNPSNPSTIILKRSEKTFRGEKWRKVIPSGTAWVLLASSRQGALTSQEGITTIQCVKNLYWNMWRARMVLSGSCRKNPKEIEIAIVATKEKHSRIL